MSNQAQRNLSIAPQALQFNLKTQAYPQDLHQSKAHSSLSHVSLTPQDLLKYFTEYVVKNKLFDIAKLHASTNLKLKKYKQSVYYGEYVNGKRHGKGIMMYDSGRIYEGSWQCDYKHGEGYQKFYNQCVYQGEYVNGRPEGVGRYSWPNGQFYQGQWVNGFKHGSGMWRGAKGDSYIGQWKFGKADGYGVHTWINGDRYQGQFRECLKYGQGIQKFANGDIYKGAYINGKPCGFGQYYWANGSYFKGLFKNGLRDGQGMWKRSPGNSDKYEGQYVNDKKSGYGIFTWSTGNVYKGNYQSDQRNGYGQMYWNDGSNYKGEWKNGIQNGNGQIYVPGQGFKRGVFQDNVLVILQKQMPAAFQSRAYLQQQDNHDTIDIQKINQAGKDNKSFVMPSKVSFRSRGYSSKNRSRQPKNLQQNNFAKFDADSQFQPSHQLPNNNTITKNTTLISSKNQSYYPNHNINNRREQKYITLQRRNLKSKPQNPKYKPFQISSVNNSNNNKTLKDHKQFKQRILHSSFYMHKLHNRANTSINGSKGDIDKERQSTQSNMFNQNWKSKDKNIVQDMRYNKKGKDQKFNTRTPFL